MILQESLDIQTVSDSFAISEMALTDADLQAINAVSFAPLTAEEVYIFPAKLTDAKSPTRNKRVWTEAWAEANAPKFVGCPLSFDHDATHALRGWGRIYAAEVRDGSLYAKGFIPTNTPEGRQLAESVKSQKPRMSIQADVGTPEHRDGLDYIMPSPQDRILEVSFLIDKPAGCTTCGVMEACPCESHNVKSADDPFRSFAEAAFTDLKNEYIRLARFALGEGVKKSTYQTVCESVDPLTLKAMAEDLKRVIADKQEQEPKEPEDVETELTLRLKDRLQAIRKTKGV